ncbi:hypothetical protein N7452_011129 [Penicillium brevicompactum]|uniref:Aminoglycoside phosphotransferase domain-containing protein n=1 Tax=Penicillium brevicompactum TaxID=5074 RepID=A0A9W9Q1L4_PENBR|nr:hypothetical protein N7452_011129 [Penicillium brevicompactum]
MTLARAALDPNFEPHVVPRLYGWTGTTSEKGEPQQGWILQELMPGIPLEEKLDDMEFEEKKEMFSQIARILKGLQDFQLPASITQYGGLTFDDENNIVSSPMTTTSNGPWSSYEAAFEAQLKQALEKADENSYIRGWHENGVRDRLEAFIERGLSEYFKPLESRDEKAIIHADFTPNNLLFDTSSGRITGLIDYDFSCILHPAHEFLCSFSGVGGKFGGWFGVDAREERALRKAQLHGFPDPLPDDQQDGEGVQWKVSKDALQNAGCKRPMTIPGIDVVADIDALLSCILPWRVTNSDILRRQTNQAIQNCRNENEKILVEILEHIRF